MRLGRQPTRQSLAANAVAFILLVGSAWARWLLRGSALEISASAMALIGIGIFIFSQTLSRARNCDFE